MPKKRAEIDLALKIDEWPAATWNPKLEFDFRTRSIWIHFPFNSKCFDSKLLTQKFWAIRCKNWENF